MDVLLINCDKTYPLDSVEDLLKRANTSDRNTRIEKRYCSVSELQAVSEEVRRRELLCGVFVVNAYESRLSINEEKAGIGYAVLYRALLEAAQGRVLVVIGGDDRYKDGEQDTSVLSTWAYHKIAAQFDDTYLDGRRGFVFSWDQRHNPVHQEALGSYLRAITAGQPGLQQPFKPTPPPKPLPKPEPSRPPSTSTDQSQTRQTGPKSHRELGLQTPLKPKVLPGSEKSSTLRQATTSETPKKETPTQPEPQGNRKDAGSASSSQQHTDVHGPSHTSRPVDQQRNDKESNESPKNVKAGEDEHKTVSPTTNVGSDPLGATTPPAPPHGTHNKQQHPTTSRESMPGQRYSHFDPTILCLSLLNEEEVFKLAKCLKENVEKSTQGRTVRVVQLYVDGNERSRYDYPEGGNAFPIPDNIQRAIDEVKSEKGAVVIVVFDDGVFGGVGWDVLPIPSDPIGKLSQQLREKVERDKEGRVVKVIQIFVDGKIANRYDYPESADVFHIPDYIRPRIKGKGFEAVVIFDDGPCKDPRKEELGSRCLNLDDLIYELP
ncbi:uncharacterized protein LOC144918061 [Branchiostoma floridae x Branchiostoma belcheri]